MKARHVIKMEEEDIVAAYKKGGSLRDVAALFDLHPTTISRILDRHSVPKRSRRGKRNSREVTGRAAKLRERERTRYLRHKYGLSPQDIKDILKSQKGRCAVCRKKIPNSWGNGMAIDHDHKTGAVRGILCPLCNTGLGSLQDNPRILIRALQYLLRETPRRLLLRPLRPRKYLQGAQGVLRETESGQVVISTPKALLPSIGLHSGCIGEWRIKWEEGKAQPEGLVFTIRRDL